jgi:hypothetical protein
VIKAYRLKSSPKMIGYEEDKTTRMVEFDVYTDAFDATYVFTCRQHPYRDTSCSLWQSIVNATNDLDRLTVSARGGEWRDHVSSPERRLEAIGRATPVGTMGFAHGLSCTLAFDRRVIEKETPNGLRSYQ